MTPNWRPTDSDHRIQAIDIIRGLALFGVLIINILSDFRRPLLEQILGRYDGLQGLDRIVELATSGILEFKSLTIFSFLFGAGIAIQWERASSRTISVRYFLFRRLSWLLVLGAIHLFLIWNGDILTLYAICGLLVLPLLSLPWPAHLAIGAACIALPEFAWFGIDIPSGAAATAILAQTREVYGHGSYFAILQFRWHETWSLIIPILISVLPRTVGLMYWGVAAWRSGLLLSPHQHRAKLVAVLVLAGTLGGLLTANDAWKSAAGHRLWPALRVPHLDPSILLAAAYVSALLLWLTPHRAARLRGLAALGRMALTNYLVQSIVLGFIFYGYGFGLFGRLGPAAATGVGLAIYVAQIYWSRYWLERYRFGPFEWLWRSLTYGIRQPMD